MSILDKINVGEMIPHVFTGKYTNAHMAKMRHILFRAVAHLAYASKNPDLIDQDFEKYVKFLRILDLHGGFGALLIIVKDRPEEARAIFKTPDTADLWAYYRNATERRQLLSAAAATETLNALGEKVNFPTFAEFLAGVGDAPVNRQGKIVRRIRNFLFKNYGINLPDIFWEYFGQRVRDFGVIPETRVWWRVTREFNWTPGDFGDDRSCVMSPGGAYAHVRRLMHAIDKFYAIQVFLEEKPEYTVVKARKKYAHGMARALLLQADNDLLVMYNAYIKPQWRSVANGASSRINEILTPVLGAGIPLIDLKINGLRYTNIYINVDTHYAYGREVPQRLDIEVPELRAERPQSTTEKVQEG